MPIDSKHPDYNDRWHDWKLMEDVCKGARRIKEMTSTYLPVPSGFTDATSALYTAYLIRAQFPAIVTPTITGMVGLIHRQEAEITLPEALKPLTERVSKDGLTIEAFHRKITENLLKYGRYSILTDVSEQGDDLPYLVGYCAKELINWSEDRDLFVLDETKLARLPDGFDWQPRKSTRALLLRDGVYEVEVQTDAAEDRKIIPNIRGGANLTEIPFVVVNATGLEVDPVEPPLLNMANSALAAYRLDADRRLQLFMSGQETFVVFTPDPDKHTPKTVGAGVVIGFPANEGCDAKYVGISGVGLEAVRQAILDEMQNAVTIGARMFDSTSKAAEAAEALRLRFGAQTATLSTVAISSAQALERALRYCAVYMGIDPNGVIVKPNMKFVDTEMTPADAEALVRVWQSKAISYQTLYENLQKGGIASPERTAEEEQTQADGEDILDDPEFEDEDTQAPPATE